MPYKKLAVIALGLIMFSCNNVTSNDKPDILQANLDTTTNPADDFFQYANGGWIKNNPIPGDQGSWGIGNLVIEENLKRLKEIAEEASKKNAAVGTDDQKIGDFWNVAMDTVKIEKDGILPLQQLFDKVKSISNVSGLLNIMAQLDKINISTAFGFYVGQDAKNSSVYALQMYQTGLGLPEREYYLKNDTDMINKRNAYVHHISKMLTMIGTDTSISNKSAQDILLLETEMAKSHRKREDLRDPYANYNKFAIKDLSKISTSVIWPYYLNIMGVINVDSIIIGQPEYYIELGKLLGSTSIETWKDYLRYRILDHYAQALPEAFGNEDFAFGKLFSGAKERKPRWKRVISSEEDVMGELLGKLFVKEYFDETAKKRYSDMVESIRTALHDRIQNLTWMSESTKQKAYLKLAAIKKKVGYPDKWKDFSALKIGKESYVQNLMNADIFWHNYNINKLGKPINKDEWGMYPQTYNAYYDPGMNEIVLPAGIFTVPGYKDSELDDALVYGYAAASTIGHEITHGFDDEGRQFDAEGNLVSWWNKEDEKKFNARADVMVKQFDAFVPIDSLHINGRACLGENIADLGGILLGWDAFVKTQQYKENKPLAGLSPAQRYFLGYSLGWLGHTSPEQLRNRILTDVHSPGKYRVNGPFQDVDAFYSTFNVKVGHKMYLADSARVRIW